MRTPASSVSPSELTGRAQRATRAHGAYPELVRRACALVESAVPAGAVVAVLSKGDPNLLGFSGRRGMHFPHTPSGEYAGHHPADGNDAVRRLQATQAAGATHLVIPQTSAWWLDHYVELREHLERNASLITHDTDVGMVYELNEPAPGTSARGAAEAAPSRASGQLIELLHNLLPDACTLVIASTRSVSAPEVPGRVVWPLLIDGMPSTPLTRTLEDMRSRGAEFMVVPAAVCAALQRHTALQRRLARSCPRLIDQRHVCVVYDLRGGWL